MTPSEYKFHTDPLGHQRADFLAHADDQAFAHFHEQGTGKTKIFIDNAAYLYQNGEIDGVVVVCPGSVCSTWSQDEIPTHLPRDVWRDSSVHVYQTERAATKWHARAVDENRVHDGLAWLIMGYESMISQPAKNALWKFLRRRRVLYVLDESSNIQTPSAKRTISIVASAKYAKYRRLLEGTPDANGPFDLYSQIRFLDEDFWAHRGLATSAAFRAEFALFDAGWNATQGKSFQILKEYRNLDKLAEWLKQISSRVLKSEVLDLPPKIYSNRYFSMSKEQERLYTQLRDEYRTELAGREIETPLAVTRLLRLQQICCGYLPTDAEEPVHRLAENPRLDLLREVSDERSTPMIIWARFNPDIDQICEMLGPRAVRYDGQVSPEARERAKQDFKAGRVDRFVAKASVGGTGLTMNEAKTHVYYSSSFSLRQRLQSEDRSHRVGQTDRVEIIDLMAQGGRGIGARTVDWRIAQALKRKYDVASQITGNDLREWLE